MANTAVDLVQGSKKQSSKYVTTKTAKSLMSTCWLHLKYMVYIRL